MKSLLLKIVAAFLVTWLLMQTKLDFNKQVVFVVMVGLLIGLMMTVPNTIWYCFPVGYTLAVLVEVVVGWFFAGIAIAKLIK